MRRRSGNAPDARRLLRVDCRLNQMLFAIPTERFYTEHSNALDVS
jgi:hypothetical protein